MIRPSKERYLRAHCLALRLHWAGNLVTGELDAQLSAIATNFQQMSLLAALAHHAADSPAELARVLHANPSAITRALDTLEERALVTRSQGQQDRRTVRVELTTAGDAFLQHVSSLATDVMEARFARLAAHEAERLVELLLIVMADDASA